MPKIVDHDLYRKELLLKCFDLFAHKGYSSITMRQIAQELGVSTGTLYHYFPSKEALYLQLVEEQTEQDILSMTAQVRNGQTLTERIEALFDFAAKNQDYFLKQILISVDFYQQQDPASVQNNETLKQSCERTRQAIAECLGIEDPGIINFATSLVLGSLLTRLFEGDVVSIADQGVLLGKMLQAYFGQNKEET